MNNNQLELLYLLSRTKPCNTTAHNGQRYWRRFLHAEEAPQFLFNNSFSKITNEKGITGRVILCILKEKSKYTINTSFKKTEQHKAVRRLTPNNVFCISNAATTSYF